MLGELPFTVALAGLGVIGLREFFAMTEDARPIAPAAYIALPAMVFAAHFGDAFQILLIGTSCFLLLFILGAQEHWRDGVTISMGVTVLGLLWIGLPFVHAVLLRDLPLHGGGAADRRARRHLRHRHRRLRGRPCLRPAARSRRTSHRTRPSRE